MITALVPAKCFHRAKSRLHLAANARHRLARRFLEHVLVTAAGIVDETLVITDCAQVAAHARLRGARSLVRPRRQSLRLTIDEGLQQIGGDALVLMSDLPLLGSSDLAQMKRLLRSHDMVIAPDRHHLGTNALALRPANVMRTCFGRADSFAAHLGRARALGLHIAVHDSRRIGFDVDYPRDLALV